MKSVSKRLSGSMQICLPRFWAYAAIVLRFFTTVFHCFLYSPAGPRPARPHHRRAVQHHHLVDDLLQVVEAVLLLPRRAAQIAIRSQAGADRAANQALLVQFALHMRRVDVRWVLDGNLDAVKAPFLELLEQFG